MGFNLSVANDEAAILTAVGAFAATYLLGGDAIRTALGIAIIAGLGVLGYTGYTAAPVAVKA